MTNFDMFACRCNNGFAALRVAVQTTGTRRDVMGDKGGKKDKEKGQKQNTEKQKQKSRDKLDKQPKRKP